MRTQISAETAPNCINVGVVFATFATCATDPAEQKRDLADGRRLERFHGLGSIAQTVPAIKVSSVVRGSGTGMT